MFFVISAVFAYYFVGPNVAAIALDIACIFAAILFTEIVQALVYRSFGLRCTVMIQEFGGGVTPDSEPPFRIQRITAALSCPASSFLLYALLIYSNDEYHWDAPGNNAYIRFAFFILKIVSLFWGIIGLLPMFPWPGGRGSGRDIQLRFAAIWVRGDALVLHPAWHRTPCGYRLAPFGASLRIAVFESARAQ